MGDYRVLKITSSFCFLVFLPTLLLPDSAVSAASSQPAPECEVTDLKSLQACYEAALSKTVQRIAITKPIVCTGENACHLKFAKFAGPLVIYGKNAMGTKVSVTRTDHFDYSIIDISGSSSILIRNLAFFEGQTNRPKGLFGTPGYGFNATCDATPPGSSGPNNGCPPTVSISFQSSDIMIDHITIRESKGFPSALAVGTSEGKANTNITIRNSVFYHSWAMGIWTVNGTDYAGELVPNNLKIENNLFANNRCSGIEASTSGTSVISGNFFDHNHMGSIYGEPGGQLAVETNTTGLSISDNTFTHGFLNEDASLASKGWDSVGLELTPDGVTDVTVSHNYFFDNPGGGMIHDPSGGSCGNAGQPPCNFGPVFVENNIFNLNLPSSSTKDVMSDSTSTVGFIQGNGNCNGWACVFTKSTGQISANASTCAINQATGTCSLNISWSSIPALPPGNVKVLIDRMEFAGTPVGSQNAPWITSEGQFDLYDGNLLLGSVFVGTNKAPPIGVSLSPAVYTPQLNCEVGTIGECSP